MYLNVVESQLLLNTTIAILKTMLTEVLGLPYVHKFKLSIYSACNKYTEREIANIYFMYIQESSWINIYFLNQFPLLKQWY